MENGYRLFDPTIEHEIRLIMLMQSVGVTLIEIRSIIAPDAPLLRRVTDVAEATRQMTMSLRIYAEHLDDVRREIDLSKRRERALEERIESCRAWLSSNCSTTVTPKRIGKRTVRPGRVEYSPSDHPR